MSLACGTSSDRGLGGLEQAGQLVFLDVTLLTAKLRNACQQLRYSKLYAEFQCLTHGILSDKNIFSFLSKKRTEDTQVD